MTGRVVNVSRTISMIALLTFLLMFVGIDGMGQASRHNADHAMFHQEVSKQAGVSSRHNPQDTNYPSVTTGPVFVAPVGNQTAAIGREVVFSCSVRNIGKYKVGWLRASDQTILSVNTRTVTHNARITVSYETGGSSGSGAVSGNAFGVTGSSQATEEVVNGTWRLHIRQLKETDRDCYMCQINTSPMISQLGCLDILGGSTFERHETYNGSLLQFHRVERRQMGVYLCIASNDVPPAVSKRVTLAVNFVPVVKAPNQLLGAPLATNVQLECYVEAYPNTINYWMKNRQGSGDEMLIEGHKYSVREERSGYTVLMSLLIKDFTGEDVGSYRCVSTNSLGKADGILRLYEIKMGFDRTSRGKDHVSIIGGLAEAAQSSGANSGSRRFFGYSNKLSHLLSTFLFIPVFLWPR
ncbi:lachesin isoform X4 [Nomia melanderi]|uniref:lachesin isoform X4 n=1 Tax=Nomia melanderi TaxID=2448451 RepID=UPI00130408C7|nr:lachesin-like isoform X6 [Nomia melanderi]